MAERDNLEFDVFVSHAGEDKADFVEPLVDALRGLGLRPWYDAEQVQLGDDLFTHVNRGLSRSRYGVVVLSPGYRRFWHEEELAALFGKEWALDSRRILPIRHGLSQAEVASSWPLLATRLTTCSSEGPQEVARQIRAAVDGSQPRARPLQPTRLYQVGNPSVHFVGRRGDLDFLQKHLLGREVPASDVSIDGLAGSGKTELAIRLCHELSASGEFPGGIFWLNCERADLVAEWALIAGKLGIPQGPADRMASLAVRMLGNRGCPLLLVLDNVTGWTGPSAPEPLPTGPHVRRLVTTRRRRLGGSRFRHGTLDVLPDEAARSLLASIAGDEVRACSGFEALIRHLDGHALALELAGAFLATFPSETPRSYLALLTSGDAPDEEISAETRYEATVDEALKTTWERLAGDVRHAWLLCARFEPEPVTAALLDACGLDRRTRGELRRLSLLEDRDDRRFRMHRLVGSFGRRAGDDDARRAAAEAHFRGCRERTSAMDSVTGHEIYLPDRPQFDALCERIPTGACRREWALMLNDVGTARQSAGLFAESETALRQALRLSIEDRDEADPEIARCRSDLAAVLRDRGKLEEARDLLEEALAADLTALGEDHPDVAIDRNNLAMVLKDLGDLAGARDLLQRALDSAIRRFGDDHPKVALRRSNLAMVLLDSGDLVQSKALLEAALRDGIRDLTDEHPQVAIRRSNLARVLRASGDLVGARRQAKEALRIARRLPEGARVRERAEETLSWLGD